MRFIPWVSRREHNAVKEALDAVTETVKHLEKQMAEHMAMVGKELHKIKYGRPSAECNITDPLTPEQEKIFKEFNENSKLPEQIRRDFARGGQVKFSAAQIAALGRIGEGSMLGGFGGFRPDLSTLEAYREWHLGKPFEADMTVQVNPVQVNWQGDPDEIRKKITDALNSMPSRKQGQEPVLGAWPKKLEPLPTWDPLSHLGKSTGILYREPKPQEKSTSELIDEDHKYMDEQAQFNADLQDLIDDTKPKE